MKARRILALKNGAGERKRCYSLHAQENISAAVTQEIYHPRTTRMWALLAPSAAYLVWIVAFPDYSFGLLVDGSVGVLLGLSSARSRLPTAST